LSLIFFNKSVIYGRKVPLNMNSNLKNIKLLNKLINKIFLNLENENIIKCVVDYILFRLEF
jgi:hypothetical protein